MSRRGLIEFFAMRHGRFVGAAILVVVLVLQVFSGGYLYAAPRRALFDLYARTLPRHRVSAPVVIVAIDEASLRRDGQWPWPRQRIADLIAAILSGHPAALGIDILMPEPDRLSPANWIEEQGTRLPPMLVQSLKALPDHDETLADVIRRGPVVLGVAGERDGHPANPGPVTPILSLGEDALPWLPRFDSYLRSIPVLDAAAAGHGILSVDKDRDGVVRRLPLVSAVGIQLVPSISLDMLRLATGSRRIDLGVTHDGISGVRLGDLTIPTQADGSAWLHLSPHDERRFLSAADVLDGHVKPSEFDQRFVLLGFTGLGLVDMPTSALGPMPGVELHAQFLENVFDGDLAHRPRWALVAEAILTFTLGVLLVLILPRLRYRWYPVAALGPIGLLFAGGMLAWRTHQWLIDASGPAIGVSLVFVGLIGGSLAEIDSNRRQLRLTLEQKRLKEAKIDGELQAAQRIQIGILPQVATLPKDDRFDLDASMTPARQVGGDLYDFFKIDTDHLFVAIGDVSGKGIPASLFMALGKALCKSCVLRGGGDIGDIVAMANAEISRDNVEMLFITLFAGILDLRTGLLSFCNAGHDAPFVFHPGDLPRQLVSKGGPPLCVMDDFPYLTERYQLDMDDVLILTTDGVTEAMNAAGELMGHQRAVDALAGLSPDAGATQALKSLINAVAAFAKDAEPSDDITLVAIQWHGAKSPSRPSTAQ